MAGLLSCSASHFDLPASSPVSVGLHPGPLDDCMKKMRKQVDSGKLPGFLCCVIKSGHVAHLESYGFADVAKKVPMRPDTLFRLYSQTKPVTIVGVMRLWERGLLKLEDEIAKYIPAFSNVQVATSNGSVPPSRPPTVQDLLAHTSGIGFGPGFGYEPESEYEATYCNLVRRVDAGELTSLASWCDELAKLPLRFQPGTDWGYGYSSDVLGRIAEVISQKPLDEFLQDEVLSPLGMKDTAFSVTSDNARRLASLIRREPWDGSGRSVKFVTIDDGGGSEVHPSASVFLEGRSSSVIQGGGCVCSISGGLVSSLQDYERFGRMLLNRGELEGVRLLKPDTVLMLAADWLNSHGSLPRKAPLWVWNSPGIGFSPLGQIGVPHKDAPKRRGAGAQLGTVHWGGAGGSSYMLSWPHELQVLTYTGCVYDTATQNDIWRAAFASLHAAKREACLRTAKAKQKGKVALVARKRPSAAVSSQKSRCVMEQKRARLGGIDLISAEARRKRLCVAMASG